MFDNDHCDSMKNYGRFTFLFLLLFSQHVFSQTYLFQVRDLSGKYGYANLKGEIIIPCKFERCFPFYENRAVVFEDIKLPCYIITPRGTWIKTEVPNFKIDEGFYGHGMIPYSNGLIAIKHNKWGYMDTTGKLVIPLKYSQATRFDMGYAIAKYKSEYVIISTKGKEIPINVPNIDDLKRFSEGLAPFQSSLTFKFGFIDTIGQVAIEAQFKSVGYFSGGLAWAKTIDEKVGFIDSKGVWIIPAKFDYVRDFDPESGLARVKINGQWAYTNRSGKLMHVYITEVYGDFNSGLAKGEVKNRVGYFDTKGQWAINPQFDDGYDFYNGYAAVKKDGKWGIIDREGKWIVQPTFSYIKDR